MYFHWRTLKNWDTNIFMVGVPLILWDRNISALFILLVLPILYICACRYFSIPCISRFDIGYTTFWKNPNKNNKQRPRIDIHLPPFSIASFLPALFFLYGNIFPFLNWALSFRFLSSGTLMRVAAGMTSLYGLMCFLFPSLFYFCCFLSFLLLRQNWQ